MKASEVRLGNLVMDGHDMEKVNARMIAMLAGNHADFDPIQLTEEWLIKFGFIKHGKYGYFYLDNFIIDKNKLGKFFMCDIDIHVEIETVHHLQNLYFALTGEELTLNL